MLAISILMFVLAALLGMYLLSFVLQGKETPKAIAFTHGPIASLGLLILIIYSIYYTPPYIALILFILAIFGGTMLIKRDLAGQTIPKWMAIGHGVTALVAFVALIIFTFTRA